MRDGLVDHKQMPRLFGLSSYGRGIRESTDLAILGSRDSGWMVGNPYVTGLRLGCPSSAHNRTDRIRSFELLFCGLRSTSMSYPTSIVQWLYKLVESAPGALREIWMLVIRPRSHVGMRTGGRSHRPRFDL